MNRLILLSLSVAFGSIMFTDAPVYADVLCEKGGALRIVKSQFCPKKWSPVDFSVVSNVGVRAVGPQGSKGDKGDKGDKGEVGPAGAQGPAGLPGPTGASGERGFQGFTGTIGPEGPRGLQGIKGDVGPQGAVGLMGDKGDKGDKGEPGSQGAQGLAGMKGDKGDTGPQGPVGPKGDTGAAGPQGVSGPQGPVGPQGPRGDAVNFFGDVLKTCQGHRFASTKVSDTQDANGLYNGTVRANCGFNKFLLNYSTNSYFRNGGAFYAGTQMNYDEYYGTASPYPFIPKGIDIFFSDKTKNQVAGRIVCCTELPAFNGMYPEEEKPSILNGLFY